MFYSYLSSLQRMKVLLLKRFWEEYHFNVLIQMKGYKSIGNGAVQGRRESQRVREAGLLDASYIS